jgi:hypothetical protein
MPDGLRWSSETTKKSTTTTSALAPTPAYPRPSSMSIYVTIMVILVMLSLFSLIGSSATTSTTMTPPPSPTGQALRDVIAMSMTTTSVTPTQSALVMLYDKLSSWWQSTHKVSMLSTQFQVAIHRHLGLMVVECPETLVKPPVRMSSTTGIEPTRDLLDLYAVSGTPSARRPEEDAIATCVWLTPFRGSRRSDRTVNLHTQATGRRIPNHTIVRLDHFVLHALMERSKEDPVRRLPAPFDGCPDDPTCQRGLQTTCCRSHLGLVPTWYFPTEETSLRTQPMTTSSKKTTETPVGLFMDKKKKEMALVEDIQEYCLDPRHACYACEDGHHPVRSGTLLWSTHGEEDASLFVNMTVFICAPDNVALTAAASSDHNKKTEDRICAPGFVGPSCRDHVGHCTLVAQPVSAEASHCVTCATASFTTDPFCTTSGRRRIDKSMCDGPQASYGLVSYDGQQCHCRCCNQDDLCSG